MIVEEDPVPAGDEQGVRQGLEERPVPRFAHPEGFLGPHPLRDVVVNRHDLASGKAEDAVLIPVPVPVVDINARGEKLRLARFHGLPENPDEPVLVDVRAKLQQAFSHNLPFRLPLHLQGLTVELLDNIIFSRKPAVSDLVNRRAARHRIEKPPHQGFAFPDHPFELFLIGDVPHDSHDLQGFSLPVFDQVRAGRNDAPFAAPLGDDLVFQVIGHASFHQVDKALVDPGPVRDAGLDPFDRDLARIGRGYPEKAESLVRTPDPSRFEIKLPAADMPGDLCRFQAVAVQDDLPQRQVALPSRFEKFEGEG